MRLLTSVELLSGCLLLAGLSVSGVGLAQPPGPHGGPGRYLGPPPDGFIEEHAERLGLDDETRKAIREIVEESRARGEQLRAESRDAHEELREILSQETPEESAVMKQAEDIGALELEERKNRLRALVKIRALLTADQRQELIEIRDERHHRRMHRALRACRADVAKICPDATSGRAMLRCWDEHWEELSDECRSAFEGGLRKRFRPGLGFGPPGP